MMKGLGALGDIGKMMAKAQEIQGKMSELQERLETMEVEGAAGAGLVKAIVSGKGKMVRVEVDPSLVTPEGDPAEAKAMLEDLLVAAVNDAQARAQDRAQEEMRELTDGLPLPPGMGFPG